MLKKCPEKENFTSKFTAILQHNRELIKNNNVDEALIFRQQKSAG
jgi:hypothetical protein